VIGTAPGPRLLDRPAGAGAAVAFLLFALLAIAEPLAAYSAALAIFGLPHVLSELRYVDCRFGRRVERRWLAEILLLLAAIIAIRLATVIQLLPPRIGVPAELAGVAILALACARGTLGRRALALAIGLAIGAAVLAEPFSTSVTLAVLHNLTPLALLWQLVPPPARMRAMAWAAGALLGLPLFVATGLPRLALEMLGIVGIGADPVRAGPLAEHIGVYVPPLLLDSNRAADFFTASVVAQGAHYLAVILVLPLLLRRLDSGAAGLVPWPRRFVLLLGLAAAGSLAFFLTGFAAARSYYSVAAALHAWIEIPILVLALTGGVQARSKPTSKDSMLASSDSVSAGPSRSPAIQATSSPSATTTSPSSVISTSATGACG
jgi:hypothetical protein